ncbi:MAG: type II secretion system major pseudopilin GspG [Treponema sp.]|nr:type II secretion system major pseudopilin GspG [Treponema sp.]
MKKRKKIRESDGYTFVETIVVLSVIAILAAGTTVSAGRLISRARRVSARNQIDQLYAGLQEYFLDCGRFPTTEQGIIALWQKPDMYPVPSNWNGPYVEKLPGKDPWGKEYCYLSRESSLLPSGVPENIPFVLYSFGADGEEGGEGENEDVVSWK